MMERIKPLTQLSDSDILKPLKYKIEVAGFISNLPDAWKAVEGRRKGRPPKGNRFRKVYLGDAGNTGITVIFQ